MVDSSAVLEQLQTRILTPDLYCYIYVDSTNNIAKELLENNAREGTIVIADEQYEGKGRHGRKWCSPIGGLYLSLILTVKPYSNDTPLLGLLAGCAAVEAIDQLVGIKPQLKWPNDILLNGKKIGGILCELIARNDMEFSVIMGIGINQNIPLENFPIEIREHTTSILEETNQNTSREQLIALLLNCIDSRLFISKSKSSLKFIINEWIEVTSTIGQEIEVVTEKGKLKGKAIGINDAGSLQLLTKDGILELTTGDVIHIGTKSKPIIG